jgi:hypothetical protein
LWLQALEEPAWGEELRSLHAKVELAFPFKDGRKRFDNHNTTYPLKKQLQENGLELICPETIQALKTIDRIRAQWLPKFRIIYTASPMPLWSTFRPDLGGHGK